MTENIYINKDGSGKFSVDVDASAMMAMMPSDSLQSGKNIDSTFSFRELFIENKDSIAKLPKEEQEKLKKLENFNMRMQMNSGTKQCVFSLNTDFKSVSELQDVMSTMHSINSIQNKNKTEMNSYIPNGGFGSNNSVLTYSYNKKKFSRKARVIKAATEKAGDSIPGSEMIFASSSYILKYHFPKPVKKISNNSALFSDDRKTVTLEFPLKEYMENPEKLNLEVEF